MVKGDKSWGGHVKGDKSLCSAVDISRGVKNLSAGGREDLGSSSPLNSQGGAGLAPLAKLMEQVQYPAVRIRDFKLCFSPCTSVPRYF